MPELLRAWHPAVPSVREVYHASFDHAYPPHAHDGWTVMLVDEGAVSYDLGRSAHIAAPGAVTVLPPGISHGATGACCARRARRPARGRALDACAAAADPDPPRIRGEHSRRRPARPSRARAARRPVLGVVHHLRGGVGVRSAPQSPHEGVHPELRAGSSSVRPQPTDRPGAPDARRGRVPRIGRGAHAGFFDQAHLTRHFRRVLGTTPGAFATR